jgi:3-keto-disaccharide hydrolase
MTKTSTIALALLALAAAQTGQRPLNQAPKGFVALFNGKDLTGWRGRQPNYDPREEAKLSPEERARKQAAWNTERDAHWRVDAVKGEIVSDGQSPHLATEKDYADFDLWVDWLMVSPNGDSGIYLRSYPQVQIWDPSNQRELQNGADKGSGALWNNNPDNPGRWPLVKADNPVGQWNTLRIRMIGSTVWVWLNDRMTVDGQVLDNFFDRTQPIVPAGAIELQTHGSEIRFRNIYIHEITAAEAKQPK